MLDSILISIALFVALMLGMETGFWLRARLNRTQDDVPNGSATESVVFAVLGLLLAFTFTGAASRFDTRRTLILEQSNSLGTAWLRLDLLSEESAQPIRHEMREWTRIALLIAEQASRLDDEELNSLLNQAADHQQAAWRLTIAAIDSSPKPQLTGQILPPMNDWIDDTTRRLEMPNHGPPPLVMPTIMTLAILSSVLAGYSLARRKRSLLHMLAFAGTIAFVIYVIMDLNHPRAGLFRVDMADHALREVYRSMQD